MVLFLSQDWLDLTVRLWAEEMDRPGPSVLVQFMVNGGPVPEAAYWWRLEDGRLQQAGTGPIGGSGADVTVTQTYADAVDIQTAKMDANAAIMQGRVKVAGDLAKLMSILALTASGPYKDLQRRIGAGTEYPGG
ncbi:MAG TPA: SCP2 sterol-binding domain-containing protein [Acidimicrobiales bacterium]|nr:SCP2 sterol-binding domain-containing protein [Acidimicrobiales bacterium]